MNDVLINGRFLTQPASGVQRFAGELLKALDAELEHARAAARRWRLVVPADAPPPPAYRHIEVVRAGRLGGLLRGHLWDQALPLHGRRRDVVVNLANGGPVWRRRGLSVLHDAAVYRTPRNFTRGYAVFHRLLGRLLARRAALCTVSEFSRGELADVLGLPHEAIGVIPNGSEHLGRVRPQAGFVASLGLMPGRYFLSIGSPVPNKNLRTAVEGFRRLGRPGERFVIVGSVDPAVFGDGGLNELPAGVLMPGRLSDAQIAALLREARALVFPSLYEGFGIPPLEAMLADCPVLASDIPVVREVCGEAAWTFDPRDPEAIAATLRRACDEPEALRALVPLGRERVAAYTWTRSARALLQAIDALAAPR